MAGGRPIAWKQILSEHGDVKPEVTQRTDDPPVPAEEHTLRCADRLRGGPRLNGGASVVTVRELVI